MDLDVLKKKLSSFRGDGGRVRNVSNDLLLEVLATWEQFSGTSSQFYKGIGVSQKGIASILGKAKKLKREGATLPFQEVSLQTGTGGGGIESSIPCDIEVQENNKIIRFRRVDLLIEYLKKAS
jgi:hypothetical protein